jgi:hypothetical protein
MLCMLCIWIFIGVVNVTIYNDFQAISSHEVCEENVPCGIVFHDLLGAKSQQATSYTLLSLPSNVCITLYYATFLSLLYLSLISFLHPFHTIHIITRAISICSRGIIE